MPYCHINTTTNYSFLQGASHPQEYVLRARELGYSAICVCDECSLAGIAKAHIAARELEIKLLIGSRFHLSNGYKLIAIAPHRKAYSELSGFITLARRRAPKGEYEAHMDDLRFRLQNCLIIWLPCPASSDASVAEALSSAFKHRLWLGLSHQYCGGEQRLFEKWQSLAKAFKIPMVACDQALMHHNCRKPLQDVLTAIKHKSSVKELGTQLQSNAEAYLKPIGDYYALYSPAMISQTEIIAGMCEFSLDELRYQYPQELVPKNLKPITYLRQLVDEGKQQRWPQGTPQFAEDILQKELTLIEELNYEYYFLTVHDIVRFAREKNILCQGRGSAANSVVCYCLFITEIAPGQINVLFERFISKERNEPPDIDVDFEHQRREEVIQYIYTKYSRERAALAATVITYRPRSAIRDVGKALGLEAALIDHLAKSLAWWDRTGDLIKRIEAIGLQPHKKTLLHFFALVEQILGFPRHLSQHVGGFVITQDKISDLVPLENASMPDRTVIQWDKDDLEAMGLLKVDVLALGMLTALRKSLAYVNAYEPSIKSLADIPREDPKTYDMLCEADTVGVFQIESRAQMSMLPRLRPRKFYDLVIEIAIVRPGPIQGDMVHPYLRRRDGLEEISYQSAEIKSVLESTLGVPLFQEQAIRLAMVAAGFSGGEADNLRRAMASWGKNGKLLQFEDKFISGMLSNNYELEFAQRLFEQIKGFGGYGFPESHSASFALLCYASSWLKCHHPAAFYCALLNSLPMGFYSASQLVQDARRHNIKVLPVDINQSTYENSLQASGLQHSPWAIRLGFIRVKSLDTEKAKTISVLRANKPFTDIQDLAKRCSLSSSDLQHLAAADALQTLAGNRHYAHWQAAALQNPSHFLEAAETGQLSDQLFTAAPSIEKDLLQDYANTGLSLRVHPMTLLREEYPFSRCKKQSQLSAIGNGRFVQVAGIVTGRQRPGTAKGTLFLTLEDETGNINVVVWKNTQDLYRKPLLTGKLLLIKGRLEKSPQQNSSDTEVIHVVAGKLIDYSQRLQNFSLSSRDFH
ncbi:error-prone DNA polymerase [Alteromonadaceae bacterium Bs31]|nr:error-prone DNA polymerase [Alteromonadaceae bacterium Bs31]